MADSQVSYDYFYVDVSDASLTHIWVFCRSDWHVVQGWRHKVLPASTPWVEWMLDPRNFQPLEWDRGAPPIKLCANATEATDG